MIKNKKEVQSSITKLLKIQEKLNQTEVKYSFDEARLQLVNKLINLSILVLNDEIAEKITEEFNEAIEHYEQSTNDLLIS